MRALLAILLLAGVACTSPKKSDKPRRVELRRTGSTTFELYPEEGQFPYCLAFTVSRSGPVRQLTMTEDNMSLECPAGERVAGHAFRVPLSDGPVRLYVLFTSQPISAASVSQDLVTAKDPFAWNVMDLRVPGSAALESLEFTPQTEDATVGTVLGLDAGASPPEAAAPSAGPPSSPAQD